MSENKTELKFEVDKNKLEGVFVATLMSSLTKEDAEEMVHQALVQVLQNDYHTKQVLQEVAKEVIRQHLSDPSSEWRVRMKGLVEAAMERALKSDALLTNWAYGVNEGKVPTGKLVDRMATALVEALTK